MPKGDGQLGRKRGNYRVVPTNNENKERAISLLKMFQDRIERENVEVEVADWWTANNIATLRIDIRYLFDS